MSEIFNFEYYFATQFSLNMYLLRIASVSCGLFPLSKNRRKCKKTLQNCGNFSINFLVNKFNVKFIIILNKIMRKLQDNSRKTLEKF